MDDKYLQSPGNPSNPSLNEEIQTQQQQGQWLLLQYLKGRYKYLKDQIDEGENVKDKEAQKKKLLGMIDFIKNLSRKLHSLFSHNAVAQCHTQQFLSRITNLPLSNIIECLQTEIQLQSTRTSPYFRVVTLIEERKRLLLQLKSRVQTRQYARNDVNLDSSCKLLAQLRLKTLLVVQALISWKKYMRSIDKKNDKAEPVRPFQYEDSRYLESLKTDTQFLSDSSIGKIIKFSDAFDPLFLHPYKLLIRSDKSEMEKYGCIIQLFDLNFDFAFRLNQAHKTIEKELQYQNLAIFNKNKLKDRHELEKQVFQGELQKSDHQSSDVIEDLRRPQREPQTNKLRTMSNRTPKHTRRISVNDSRYESEQDDWRYRQDQFGLNRRRAYEESAFISYAPRRQNIRLEPMSKMQKSTIKYDEGLPRNASQRHRTQGNQYIKNVRRQELFDTIGPQHTNSLYDPYEERQYSTSSHRHLEPIRPLVRNNSKNRNYGSPRLENYGDQQPIQEITQSQENPRMQRKYNERVREDEKKKMVKDSRKRQKKKQQSSEESEEPRKKKRKYDQQSSQESSFSEEEKKESVQKRKNKKKKTKKKRETSSQSSQEQKPKKVKKKKKQSSSSQEQQKHFKVKKQKKRQKKDKSNKHQPATDLNSISKQDIQSAPQQAYIHQPITHQTIGQQQQHRQPFVAQQIINHPYEQHVAQLSAIQPYAVPNRLQAALPQHPPSYQSMPPQTTSYQSIPAQVTPQQIHQLPYRSIQPQQSMHYVSQQQPTIHPSSSQASQKQSPSRNPTKIHYNIPEYVGRPQQQSRGYANEQRLPKEHRLQIPIIYKSKDPQNEQSVDEKRRKLFANTHQLQKSGRRVDRNRPEGNKHINQQEGTRDKQNKYPPRHNEKSQEEEYWSRPQNHQKTPKDYQKPPKNSYGPSQQTNERMLDSKRPQDNRNSQQNKDHSNQSRQQHYRPNQQQPRRQEYTEQQRLDYHQNQDANGKYESRAPNREVQPLKKQNNERRPQEQEQPHRRYNARDKQHYEVPESNQYDRQRNPINQERYRAPNQKMQNGYRPNNNQQQFQTNQPKKQTQKNQPNYYQDRDKETREPQYREGSQKIQAQRQNQRPEMRQDPKQSERKKLQKNSFNQQSEQPYKKQQADTQHSQAKYPQREALQNKGYSERRPSEMEQQKYNRPSKYEQPRQLKQPQKVPSIHQNQPQIRQPSVAQSSNRKQEGPNQQYRQPQRRQPSIQQNKEPQGRQPEATQPSQSYSQPKRQITPSVKATDYRQPSPQQSEPRRVEQTSQNKGHENLQKKPSLLLQRQQLRRSTPQRQQQPALQRKASQNSSNLSSIKYPKQESKIAKKLQAKIVQPRIPQDQFAELLKKHLDYSFLQFLAESKASLQQILRRHFNIIQVHIDQNPCALAICSTDRNTDTIKILHLLYKNQNFIYDIIRVLTNFIFSKDPCNHITLDLYQLKQSEPFQKLNKVINKVGFYLQNQTQLPSKRTKQIYTLKRTKKFQEEPFDGYTHGIQFMNSLLTYAPSNQKQLQSDEIHPFSQKQYNSQLMLFELLRTQNKQSQLAIKNEARNEKLLASVGTYREVPKSVKELFTNQQNKTLQEINKFLEEDGLDTYASVRKIENVSAVKFKLEYEFQQDFQLYDDYFTLILEQKTGKCFQFNETKLLILNAKNNLKIIFMADDTKKLQAESLKQIVSHHYQDISTGKGMVKNARIGIHFLQKQLYGQVYQFGDQKQAFGNLQLTILWRDYLDGIVERKFDKSQQKLFHEQSLVGIFYEHNKQMVCAMQAHINKEDLLFL